MRTAVVSSHCYAREVYVGDGRERGRTVTTVGASGGARAMYNPHTLEKNSAEKISVP